METAASCPVCQRSIPSDAKFCPYCACALTADVQGSSANAGRSEYIVTGERGVAAERIDGSFIQTGDVYKIYDELTITRGETRQGPMFPTKKEYLGRPVRILSGYPSRTTKVLGFVMADMVDIGDYCLIAGAVFGTKGVQVGRRSSIEGIVMSPERVTVGSWSTTKGVFSRWVKLEDGCTVRGNISCDRLGISDENGVNLSGNCKVEGVIASSRSLIVGDGAQLGSIVCNARVVLGSNVELSGIIQAADSVVINGNCTVAGGIVAPRVEVGNGSRLGFIICSETVNLGQSVEVDFLCAGRSIGRLGAGSRIGNPTLLSPQSLVPMEGESSISLGGIPVSSQANLLGIFSEKSIIEPQIDRASGGVLTILLTRTLYSLIRSRSCLPPLDLDLNRRCAMPRQ